MVELKIKVLSKMIELVEKYSARENNLNQLDRLPLSYNQV
jgi:hypothetical protein